MSRETRSTAQIILDTLFPVLSMVHRGEGPKDREDCMEWARNSLRERGLDVNPMGMCHAVLREPVLCREDPDWDWWLKLPQEHRGAIVQHYRALIKEIK